jgi:hypothetical protein
MNEKIESFCEELRTKLCGVDKRIKDLKASAESATEKAKLEAKAQLSALEKRAKDQRAKVLSAEMQVNCWVEEKKTTTSEKIAAWKAQHDVKKLAAYADRAEDYAVASMQLAASSVDEAERAAVEAVVARMDTGTARASHS